MSQHSFTFHCTFPIGVALSAPISNSGETVVLNTRKPSSLQNSECHLLIMIAACREEVVIVIPDLHTMSCSVQVVWQCFCMLCA